MIKCFDPSGAVICCRAVLPKEFAFVDPLSEATEFIKPTLSDAAVGMG